MPSNPRVGVKGNISQITLLESEMSEKVTENVWEGE